MDDFHILYLDNNLFLANQVKLKLEWYGYRVSVSDNEKDCVTEIRKHNVNLLIVDFHTPKTDGVNFLARLEAQNLKLATIIVNTEQDFSLAIKAMNLGCLDYIEKDSLIQQYFNRLHRSVFKAYEKLNRKKALTDKLLKTVQTANQEASIQWEYYPEQNLVNWHNIENTDKTVMSYDDFVANVQHNDVATVKTQNNICLFSQQPVEYRFHYLNDKGQLTLYQAKIQADTGKNGIVRRLYGNLTKLRHHPATDVGSRLKQAYLDNTNDAFFITDIHKRIVSINSHFSKLTGYTESEILNQPVEILNPEHYNEDFFKPIEAALKKNHFWQGEIFIRHRQGHHFPVWQSISIVKDSPDKIAQSISVLRDISQQKSIEASMQFQANYDPLTELPNRSLFLDRLSNAIKQSERNKKQLALLILDLNKFKWINDNLGHHAGDILLQETAGKMKTAVRDSDTIARLGGDEFAIIVPNLDKATDSEIIARKIFEAFGQPISIDRKEIFISGSIGITIFPDDGEKIDTLMRNADSAMYQAKNNGRNSYYFYTPALQQETEKRLKLIDDMRKALHNGEFSVNYQPIIDLKTRKIAGAETLLRWKHPQTGYVPLHHFIPVAEESGLIREIGNWVIEEVAGHINRWTKLGLSVGQISINQSVAQYNMAECHNEWLEIIRQKRISPNAISLEINEKIFLDDRVNYSVSINRLKQAGIRITLDKFGTGYSSLSYLQKYPVDIIKIDHSCIRSMLAEPTNIVLVETIINLASKLGYQVVATGVENEKQLSLLNAQCRYAQGYYFKHPLEINEFETYIKENA